MPWFRFVDGQYIAQPPCASPGHPLMSKKGLRQVGAAFDRLRAGPPRPRVVRAGPPRRRRPSVRVSFALVSQPRPREHRAMSQRRGGSERGPPSDDDGGGGEGDGPPSRLGARVLERGRASP